MRKSRIESTRFDVAQAFEKIRFHLAMLPENLTGTDLYAEVYNLSVRIQDYLHNLCDVDHNQ